MSVRALLVLLVATLRFLKPALNEWWKNEGWEIMGRRGDRGTADVNTINENLRNFVINQSRRNTQESQSESETQVSESISDFVSLYLKESGDQCSS